MITLAKILSGGAAETNPPAVIENLFAEPLPVGTNTPANPVTKFDVRSYRIEGNTALPPDVFTFLTDYTGTNDIQGVRKVLDKLQSAYNARGFTNLAVILPQQDFSNGIVRVKIIRNEPGVAATETNMAAQFSGPAFEVRGYRIEGNTILQPEKFGMLSNYTGTVDFPRIREGLGALQLLYRDLGFATVSVTVPQQKLTNGFVRLKIVEGRIAAIQIEGNRWFSSNNIRRALPSLDTNILLNTKWFQPELDRANANQDRQIYPVISPGLEPGTSDLTLKVKDQLPLRGHVEVNNKSTPGTPLLRVDAAAQYGNLWQLEHQIGFDYNFSPQQFKNDGTLGYFDQPMVTSYSGFYRLPLGYGHALRETYDSEPVDFGYDEVTHTVRQLPATGNPELTFYASRSVSETPLRYGPLSVIFTNTLANISSQFAQRDETINNNHGAKFTVPLRDFAGVHSSLSFGVDFKTYDAPSFSTNLTYFTLYALDNFGNPVLVTNQTIRLPANSRAQLDYVPLSIGWSASRPDDWGGFAFNYNESIFLTPLASARNSFQTVAGSTSAGGDYTTINAGLIRQQKLTGDWSASLNLNGQWSSAPLISNEQFALGGTGGVRGYQEGEIYGDTGWRGQFDLRAPPINVGYLPTQNGDVPAELRCSWFMDYGQAFLMDRSSSANLSYTQWGTGLGFIFTAGSHVSARLVLAWALLDSATITAGSAQVYFNVGFQF
jgi:hemolysin activation/secretion protein